MKNKYLKLTSLVLLSSLVLSSCQSSKKTDIKVRTKDKITEETEEKETETTDTEDTEPRIVTIESNLYTDAEAPIVVDWDNYQKAEQKENVFERKSEDYIDKFVTSNDYGTVLPFQATYATVREAEYEDYVQYAYQSYGLIDNQGRIICDPIFSEAYVTYGNTVIVATGSGEDKKFGAITADGTKFTGIKYDRIIRLSEQKYYYAITGNKVTIFNEDLSIYTEKTLELDFNSLDDQDLIESLERAKEEGYGVELEDIYIIRVLDKSHVLGEFWGYDFEIDLNTGKLRETADYFDPNLGVGGTYGDRYLTDKEGNQISDSYTDIAYGSRLPIFYKDGYYVGLDSEGNVVQKFPKTDYLDFVTFDEYMIVNTDTNKWTLFDTEFNAIGVYEATQQIYPSTWEQGYRGGSGLVYVLDQGNIIDPFTGEVLLEDVPFAYSVFIGNECVAASTADGYVLSNGRTFPSDEYWETRTDLITGKEYMIYTEDHTVRIYDVAADDITDIEIDGYADSYYVTITDGNVYFNSYYTDATYLYDFTDVDEPQLLFRYYYIDPLGDD